MMLSILVLFSCAIQSLFLPKTRPRKVFHLVFACVITPDLTPCPIIASRCCSSALPSSLLLLSRASINCVQLPANWMQFSGGQGRISTGRGSVGDAFDHFNCWWKMEAIWGHNSSPLTTCVHPIHLHGDYDDGEM